MIFLKNFSGNRYLLIGFLVAVFFSGCAAAPVAAPGTAPETRETPPPLRIVSLSPDKVSPQAAEMATVRWKVEAQGGVGERIFAFHITDGKEEKVAQEGSSALWAWAPMAPGIYRARVVVRDALGNAAESGWSPEYTVGPMLEVSPVTPDKASPQAAEMATVRWKVEAKGGVGKRTYAFRIGPRWRPESIV
ncbi:MAG: hypothetical protein HW377_1246 [Actinobacteria bacterium]|nr:hypothetical protein [Actinomycetota bacterium]